MCFRPWSLVSIDVEGPLTTKTSSRPHQIVSRAGKHSLNHICMVFVVIQLMFVVAQSHRSEWWRCVTKLVTRSYGLHNSHKLRAQSHSSRLIQLLLAIGCHRRAPRRTSQYHWELVHLNLFQLANCAVPPYHSCFAFISDLWSTNGSVFRKLRVDCEKISTKFSFNLGEIDCVSFLQRFHSYLIEFYKEGVESSSHCFLMASDGIAECLMGTRMVLVLKMCWNVAFGRVL